MEIDVDALKARAKVATLSRDPKQSIVRLDGVPIDFGFLSPDRLNELASFAANDPSRGAPSPRISLLPTDPDWARQGFNLPLCEFLAYKAALAYGKKEEIGTTLDLCRGVSRFEFFDTGDRDGIDTQGFGFLFEDAAFIVMRGTESGSDWAGNRNDKMTGDKPDTRWWPSASNAEAIRLHVPGQHLGFARGWRAVRTQIETWIEGLPPTQDLRPRRFVFAGHSLGGALAKIGAFDFKTIEDRDVVAVVTFGAPLVGNAQFSKSYDAALGGRTVGLESDGDIVPQIMGRWYYRLHWRARDWIERRIYGQISPRQSSLYQPAGQKWWFDKVPLLERHDFETVLTEVKNRAAREAQRRVEEAKKAKEEGEKKQAEKQAAESAPKKNADATGSTSPEGHPAGGAGVSARGAVSPGAAPSSTPKSGEPGAGRGSGSPQLTQIIVTVAGVIIGVIVVAAIGWGVYYIVRSRFTRSHEIQKRYALYLSSLSYRRLRELHGGDVAKAHRDLDNHLLLMRGDLAAAEKANATLMASLKDLPVRFEQSDDLATFEKEGRSYVY